MKESTKKLLAQIFAMVPIVSTVCIMFFTMIYLVVKRAGLLKWLRWFFTFMGAGLVNTIVINKFMSGQNPLLNSIVTWLILSFANILWLELIFEKNKKAKDNEKSDEK